MANLKHTAIPKNNKGTMTTVHTVNKEAKSHPTTAPKGGYTSMGTAKGGTMKNHPCG